MDGVDWRGWSGRQFCSAIWVYGLRTADQSVTLQNADGSSKAKNQVEAERQAARAAWETAIVGGERKRSGVTLDEAMKIARQVETR